MSPVERMIAMMGEMRGMSGYALTSELERLNFSVFILTRNYLDLKTLLKDVAANPQIDELIIARNRDQLGNLFMHITRLIHNFAAAASSLRDHTRMVSRVWNERADGRSFPDLRARIDTDFTHDPLAQFIMRFRNYCQHYGPPTIHLVVHLETTSVGIGETKAIGLSSEELLQWDGWNAYGKRYFADHPTHIDILAAATAYWTKVLAYTKWFQRREQDLFADVIRQFLDKRCEYVLLQLETEINARLAGNNKAPFLFAKEEVFAGILHSDHFAQLEQTPPNSMERAQLAILLVERDFFPLPDTLKRKIEALFTTHTDI